jgi:hypothetical protein
MGYHARLSGEAGGLTENEAGQLAREVLAMQLPRSGAISGWVRRNGRVMAFTLDTTNLAPELHRVLPEQFAIAALLLASYVASIWHLLT